MVEQLVCKQTYESLWQFTVGKAYTVHGKWGVDEHVISDNGYHLYLLTTESGCICGAGVPGHKFEVIYNETDNLP